MKEVLFELRKRASFFVFRRGLCSAFYFTGGDNNYDWTLPQNDALWRDAVKTIFDPCPEGWRVPKCGEGDHSPWRDFILENAQWETDNPGQKGAWYASPVVIDGSAWYPPAGRHTFTDGTLMNFDNEGVCWSSAVSGSDAFRFLYYSLLESRPFDYGFRCTGFSVRCVRE